MHNLDLRDFADHSLKIPSQLLNKKLEVHEVSSFKVFAAHALDVMVVLSGTVLISFLLGEYTKGMLVSNRLVGIYKLKGALSASAFFPMLLFAYFFFSNFFNHGQSYGMHTFKLRLPMKENDFAQAFQKANWSFLLCMTGGLLTPIFKKHVSVDSHDWLYQELVRERDWQTMSLLDATTEATAMEEEAVESFTLAA